MVGLVLVTAHEAASIWKFFKVSPMSPVRGATVRSVPCTQEHLCEKPRCRDLGPKPRDLSPKPQTLNRIMGIHSPTATEALEMPWSSFNLTSGRNEGIKKNMETIIKTF